MAIPFQPVSINFGQGLDSKTDPKMVVNGKLVALANGNFSKAKQLAKTNGYNQLSAAIINGGTITNPVMTKAYKNELVVADGSSLYSYSESISASAQKGFYTSAKVTNSAVSSAASNQFASSSAILGNYMLVCYSAYFTIGGVSNIGLYATVIDLQTNTRILSDFNIAYSTNSSKLPVGKCVALGSSNLAITYIDSSGNLQLKILNISGTNATFGSAILLAGNCAFIDSYAQFEIVNSSTGASFAYNTTASSIIIATLTTTGSASHTATISSTGSIATLALTADSSGQTWVYWVTGTGTVNYSVYSSTLSSVLATTAISTGVTASQIAAISSSSTSQYFFISEQQTTSGSNSWNIFYYLVTSSGATTLQSYALYGADIATRPFVMNGHTYLGVIYLSEQQGGIYFVEFDSVRPGYIVGKCYYGYAIYNSSGFGSFAPSYLCPANVYGSIEYIAIPKVVQDLTVGNANYNQLTSTFLVGIDFANQDAYQAVESSGVLVLNGGAPQIYDGATVTELGFLVFPELIGTATASGTGGSLTNGAKYEYALIYEATDSQGNLYQSSPYVFTVTIPGSTGATGSVSFVTRYLNLTQKNIPNAAQIGIFRTTGNGSLLSRITQNGQITNYVGQEGYSYLDTASDTGLSSDNVLYTNGNILANDPPPPSMIMTRHNNRVWVLDSENPNTIWPSNTVVPLNGLSFSSDLSMNIDTRGGDITGMAEMDANLVGFKSEFPFVIAGDAADTDGNNSTLTPAQFIPSDAGCVASKSVIVMPLGTLFKSNQGIYLLNRSLGIEYIGAEVEEYNSLTITAATQIQNKTQIRFLTSAGPQITYDYLFKQWGTVPGISGVSADYWAGQYVYSASSGGVYQETPGYYLYGASTSFALSLTTAWIKMSAIQGFQRVRILEILGDYANGVSAKHGLQVSCNFDFGNGLTASRTVNPFYFGAANSSGTFQCKVFLPAQKCESVQFVISEIVTGDQDEYMDLNDMTLDVGIKKGVNKLPASASVG